MGRLGSCATGVRVAGCDHVDSNGWGVGMKTHKLKGYKIRDVVLQQGPPPLVGFAKQQPPRIASWAPVIGVVLGCLTVAAIGWVLI